MAINKKLIHFQKKATFDTELAAGNILDTSIVFIKDAKLIWTHGNFYGLSEEEAEKLSNLPDKDSLDAAIADAKKAGTDAQTNLATHINNTSNPHNVTKTQVELGNVTNDAQVKRSEMGVTNGVATLDANGIVTESQLPVASETQSGIITADDKKVINNLDNTYIKKVKDSTDVQIADGSTLAIDKFAGNFTYDSTTGEIFIGYPTSDSESIVTQVIALPEATEDTAGLLSASDKSKLNTLNWEVID